MSLHRPEPHAPEGHRPDRPTVAPRPAGAAPARPAPPAALRARLAAMWAQGMSETAVRRALGLSERDAVAHGLIAPRAMRRAAGPTGARASRAAPGGRGGLRMAAVLEAVARAGGVAPEILRGRGQGRRAARLRQLAMRLLRELCPGASLATVGHLLGRDHSTVLHGCRRAEALLARDPELRRVCERARALLDEQAQG